MRKSTSNFTQKSFNHPKGLMRISIRLFLGFCLVAFAGSCNKDFYPIGEVLLQDQTLVSKSEKFEVFTYQERLEKVQANNIPLVQLGRIEHPVFGIAEASFISQLTLPGTATFGDYTQELEDQEDPDQRSIIHENETVTAVYLEIPFFTNQNDKDNDGVIDSLDADPDDPQSNSDGDELTDIIETQAGLNPLSSDSDWDGILDHNDDDNETY